MNALFERIQQYLIIILVVLLVLYIVQGVFLFKFSKLAYGRGSVKSWIPIFNFYLLGRLIAGRFFGWFVILVMFSLTGTVTIETNGNQKVYTLLPENLRDTGVIIFSIFIVVLFIIAIFKYFKMKKNKYLYGSGAQTLDQQFHMEESKIQEERMKKMEEQARLKEMQRVAEQQKQQSPQVEVGAVNSNGNNYPNG